MAAARVDVDHEGRSDTPASTATFDPAETISAPLSAIKLFLPRSPPPLTNEVLFAGVVAGGGVALSALVVLPSPTSNWRAIVMGIAAFLAAVVVLFVTTQRVITEWFPERRRRARARADAIDQLNVLSAGDCEFEVPALCRVIALAHGCTCNDLRGLTNDALRAAEDRFRLRLPRTWIVHDQADPHRSGVAEIVRSTPALYKVTRPAPWHDRASAAGIGIFALAIFALGAAAAGALGGGRVVNSWLGNVGLCCAAPLALMWLFGLAGDVLHADTRRRAPFLLLTPRGPTVFRGIVARAEPRMAPPDAFTMLFDNADPYALNKKPKGAYDVNVDQDEPGHWVRTDVVRRVRVVAPPPWGDVEGEACYRWNPVAGGATQNSTRASSSQ